MRHIKKGAAPLAFTEWMALVNEDWQPTYANLAGPPKNAVYDALMIEQGYICCYCERELFVGDFHLEHLNPQDAHAGDSLDFDNFLCSCLNITAKGAPLHCGRLKDDNLIEISPLQYDCESKFVFTASGEIDGLTPEAKRTIQTLGLDIKKLVDLRGEALEPFLDENIDDAEFARFVEGYLTPSAVGRLNPFHTMVKKLFDFET